jgi:tetratricopeptide (TPR) repeat protein
MTRGQLFSYGQARKNKRRSDVSRWANIAGGFSAEVWPEIQPSFRIGPGQTVFTIGSCFARNIERFLVDAGCRVPMQELCLPPEEWHGGANSAMNKFHPPAFRQCLGWTAEVFDRDGVVAWSDCAPLAFELEDGRVFDMEMATTPPVTRERFLERRQHIYDVFSTAFSADCLMITPGLIEAWYDKLTGLYIHEAPTLKAMAVLKDRWEFEILSYEQCLADLLAAIDIVRGRNPGVKVLITTSPVPMAATFSGQDVRIANSHSKSVLRAVCGAASLQRPMVDYFPSYEAATLSAPELAWESDRLHVAGGFIGKIVAWMLDHYLEGGDEAALALQRARTFLYDARYAEAEAAAREALQLQPDEVEAGVVLSEALIRLFRIPEAEDELRRWIALHPQRAQLRIALARAIFRGDHARGPEAIAEIEAAVILPTMGLSEFRSIGELVRRRAPPEVAERLNRLPVERFPLHVEGYGALVNVLLDQGRAGEAIELLRKASALRRAPAAMRLQLAELLIGSGQGQEAEGVVQGVLNLEHGNEAAKALLAQLQGAKASV